MQNFSVQNQQNLGIIVHQCQATSNPYYVQEDNLIYDPFQIPPSLSTYNFIEEELARLHHKAKMIGLIDFEKNYDSRQLCPCCNLPFEKEPIPLCFKTKRLGFLGQGFPLFFQSTKMYCALLIIICGIVSVYNVATTAKVCYKGEFNVLNREAPEPGCYNFLGIMYTINKTEGQLLIQSILCLIGVLVTCVGLYVIKYYQTALSHQSDEEEITASDYTIVMSNVKATTSVNQIREYFAKHYKMDTISNDVNLIHQEVPPEIIRIICMTKIDDYVKWSKQKVSLLTEQKRTFANIVTTNELRNKEYDLQRMNREIKILDQKIKMFEEDVQLRVDGQRAPYVLVTFQTQEEMRKVLEMSRETFFEKIFLNTFSCLDKICFTSSSKHAKRFLDGNRIYIERAAEPLDILWENLSVSKREKTCRSFISICLSLILIIAGGFILFAISYLQNSVQQDDSYNMFFLNYFLSFLCALLILMVNYLLQQLVCFTSKFEKHSTNTKEIKSAVTTLIIMQFINTALIPFALLIFTRDIFDQTDLMSNLFFIFIGNVFLVPAYVLFDPLYYWRLRKRKQIINQGFKAEFTQMESHYWFEGPDFDVTDKMTTINKSILTSTFYSSIFPYGAMLEILALVTFYWASKYVLLKRCAWPSNLSSRLQETVFNLMTIMPLALAFGGLSYELVVIDTDDNISIHIINIILATIGMILLQFITVDKNRFSIQRRSCYQTPLFTEQKLFLPVDYDRCNPVTRTKALDEWQYLWKIKEDQLRNPEAHWIPMVMKHNFQLLYGMNIPTPNIPPRINQVHPDDRPKSIIQENQQLEQGTAYLPGNEAAEFHRHNLMCSQIFVQKQMLNRNR